MIASSHIRKAIYAALNGAVTHNSAPVPVYENEATEQPYQIIIGEYTDSDASNKDTLAVSAKQVVEVVAIQKDSTRKAVDTIGNAVMGILKPSPATSGIASGADFQVFVQGMPSTNYLTEDTGSGYVVRLILRFNLFINQISYNS